MFNVIRNVTEALIDQFPDTQILPSFGNHDPYPSNQMPMNDLIYYSSIMEVSHWNKLLPSTARETFLKGTSVNTSNFNEITKLTNHFAYDAELTMSV